MRPLLIGLIVLLSLAACAYAGEHRVTIRDMKFEPASITVAPGDTVVWTNTDDRAHTATATEGSFDSGDIAAGESFTHKFSKAATIRYRCNYHPRMKGTVEVKK